jgi:hypothetical protein
MPGRLEFEYLTGASILARHRYGLKLVRVEPAYMPNQSQLHSRQPFLPDYRD